MKITMRVIYSGNSRAWSKGSFGSIDNGYRNRSWSVGLDSSEGLEEDMSWSLCWSKWLTQSAADKVLVP
jgi:hypothetical protein